MKMAIVSAMVAMVIMGAILMMVVDLDVLPRISVLGREQVPVSVQIFEDGSYVLWGSVPWKNSPEIVGGGCIPQAICQDAIASGDFHPIYPE